MLVLFPGTCVQACPNPFGGGGDKIGEFMNHITLAFGFDKMSQPRFQFHTAILELVPPQRFGPSFSQIGLASEEILYD